MTLVQNVIYGQSADNITSDIDLVVYTAAIHESNPEFAAAKAAGNGKALLMQNLCETAHACFHLIFPLQILYLVV